jgi:hypothetical protein
MFHTHNAVRLKIRSPDCLLAIFHASSRLAVPFLSSGKQQWLSLYDSCKSTPRGIHLTVFNASQLTPHSYLNKWTTRCVILEGHWLHSRKANTNRISETVFWAQPFSKMIRAGGMKVQGDKSQICHSNVCVNVTEGCLTFIWRYTLTTRLAEFSNASFLLLKFHEFEESTPGKWARGGTFWVTCMLKWLGGRLSMWRPVVYW